MTIIKQQLLILISFLLPIAAIADDNGTCGDNLSWKYIESTHTLTISGIGTMTNFSWYGGAPWYNIREKIETVILESGVTSIGNYAFYDRALGTPCGQGRFVE